MPAFPDKGLHANRTKSVPTDGTGPTTCFSRSDILIGETPTAFGSAQNMAICNAGESINDPTTWPKLWPKAGRVLKVPQVVILSSVPQWTCWWQSCYFYGPRDVIGDDLITGALGNYYYFDQYNNVITETTTQPDYSFANGNPNYDSGLSEQATTEYAAADLGYLNNQVWSNFDASLTTTLKNTIYNQRQTCTAACDVPSECAACADTPSYIVNMCPSPPQVRFSQIVGSATNPYYTMHQQLCDAFIAAKKILESDPDNPIYVIIPGWMPRDLYQTRNASLTQNAEQLNPVHGGAVNGLDCDVFDASPCYLEVPVCWAPAYPDVNNPRNGEGFQTNQVPWLSSAIPGFGTNVLHLYVGHPNMKYFSSNSIWDYQAWPLTPEVQWLGGPVFQGNYLGSAQPFFAGKRSIWRDAGFDYGYTGGITAQSLYNTRYSGIVEGAANQYKEQFYNYRNLVTQIFTYPAVWNFAWNPLAILKDRENTCPATQFYFGFDDFEEYAGGYDTTDNSIADCSQAPDNPAHLKYGETSNYFPSQQSINDAVTLFYPPIMQRIQDYYNSIEPGSADFFKLSIKENGLSDYGVSYEGPLPGALLTADGIVSYVRAYFKKNP